MSGMVLLRALDSLPVWKCRSPQEETRWSELKGQTRESGWLLAANP